MGAKGRLRMEVARLVATMVKMALILGCMGTMKEATLDLMRRANHARAS